MVARFARRLKRTREARGLSQTELARRAKLTQPFIALLEQARREPSIVTVWTLARVLKVGIEDLVR